MNFILILNLFLHFLSLFFQIFFVKAGPVVTDNSNFLLDWHWNKAGGLKDWAEINTKIVCMPGVLETGLFVKMAAKAYFGLEDGTVREKAA